MTIFTHWLRDFSSDKELYFAYGSNMNRPQMNFRCKSSSAVAIAKLPNWKFLINSRGVATLVPKNGKAAYGVVWAISRDNEKSLDYYEGVREKVYSKSEVEILIEEKKISTLIYIAEDQSPGVPRKGYLETVIEGAKSFNAHQEWLAELKSWAN